MSATSPEILLGGGEFGSPRFPDAESTKGACDLFRKRGWKQIDQAPFYPALYPEKAGRSEELMAEAGVTEWATIDTKINIAIPHPYSKENIVKSLDKSLTALGGGDLYKGKIGTLFISALPVLDETFENILEVLNEAHQQGKFESLGVTNFAPEQLETILDIAEKHGYIKPKVLQAHYNLVTRKCEKLLFPILRKHNISFHAYTPAGAGIFSGKVTRASVEKTDGRWTNNNMIGTMFARAYFHDEIFGAVEKIRAAAEQHGISGHAVALRWMLHHSMLEKGRGDAMVIGFGSLAQLESNLDICEQGPLPEDVVKVVDDVWPSVESVAPWAYIENTMVRPEWQENLGK